MSLTLETLPLLLRRRGALADVLPVIGFAASTAVSATVLGGLTAFIGRLPDGSASGPLPSGEESVAGFLVFCAAFATVLLVPSALALGGGAARLSLARRERDLAAIRLIGGSTGQVGGVAVLDVAAQCLLGSVFGIVAHLAVTPALTGLDFGIRPFTVGELLLSWWAYPLLVLALVAMAAGSAAIALTGVVLSPLGVARESRNVRMSVVRLIIWVVLVALFLIAVNVLPQLFGAEAGTGVVLGIMVVTLGAMVAGVNIAGPFLVWLVARMVARIAPWPALMVGARRLAADPRSGWRAVAGVTFAMVIAGFLTVITLLTSGSGASMEPSERMMVTALQTGGALTMVIAAILAAVGTGVPQTARVIDQAPTLRAQHVAGAQVGQLQRARLAEISIPLVLSGIVATGMVGLVLASTVSGALTNPQAIVTYLLAVVLAYAMVLGSVLVASPLVKRAALSPR